MPSSTRTCPIGAFNSTSAVASSTTNEGPGGCIGYYELQSNTSTTGTSANAAVLNSVPINSGRLIKVTGSGTIRASGPTGLQVILFEDSTELIRRNGSVGLGGVDQWFHAVAFSHAPSAGNHNYTLAFGITGGGGATCQILANNTDPTTCYLMVEDCGPDF